MRTTRCSSWPTSAGRRASPSTPSYTWVPRWTETGANTTTGIGNAYVDDGLAPAEQRSVLLAAQAPHHRLGRLGAAVVPQSSAASPATCSAAGRSRRRSSSSPASPGTCPATSTWRRASIRRISRCAGEEGGQFIYGVKPCIGQRNATTGKYDLLSVSTAYGCTEPYFLIRETYPAPHGDVPLRRVPPAVATGRST